VLRFGELLAFPTWYVLVPLGSGIWHVDGGKKTRLQAEKRASLPAFLNSTRNDL
jgi:hypothetical protein